MTKTEALYSFFSGFGIPAYEENAVYDMANEKLAPAYPYLTYEVKTDFFGESDVFITFSLWYRSTSWTAINAKSAEISAAIGRIGKFVDFDEGSILIMRSQPWAQNMGDGSDDMVKRIVHNLKLRYYSNN
jgi:hypothetical protein